MNIKRILKKKIIFLCIIFDSEVPIEVKTIAYNDKFDYYTVSLKQLVLGESSMVEHSDLYNALKNIKIE